LKTAIVIGATGLIGSFITLKLLEDNRYEKVKVFVRNHTGIKHPKLEENIVDFDLLKNRRAEFSGDELFSALGTTIKKAGSKEAQYKIDFTYQYETAKAALENGVKSYFLVSSIGANYKSNNFYLRLKGELDEKVKQLYFERIRIFRPSILVGSRNEKRTGESIGIKASGIVTSIIPGLKKYKPIDASVVAEAMIKSANSASSERMIIYNSNEISDLVKVME
jgi:uncharacterized protein YbjT (DUF2867 family)